MATSKRQRERQRANRKYGKEEPLDRTNAYGISNPTPRAAVKHIIKKGV